MVATRMVRVLAMLSSAAVLSACQSSPDGAGRAVSPVGSWALDEIDGVEAAEAVPATAQPVTLTVGEDGQISGSSGVNRYAGRIDPASWAGGSLSFGPLAVTRMAGPPEAMEFESRFLTRLGEVESYRLEGGELELHGAGGKVLEFDRVAD
jgi:putative lipoprotein